ncbi:MAG: thiamine-phosphate kinase [Elusimicrobia bacterium]|nr:thiamine-phosphate kinase [Elusimicrobiota bacterium]
MPEISKIGEAKILDWIERNYRFQKDSGLLIGPGDDAAVLKTSPGKVLVITTDEMVEGVHFPDYTGYPAEIAQKLLRINLSDLAAMGNVKPLVCVVGAGLPRNLPVEWVKKFTRSLAVEAKAFGLSLAGGNLARSKTLHVYATVLGEALPGEIITRYGAKSGDYVYSAGFLGDAKAGLEIAEGAGRNSRTAAEQRASGSSSVGRYATRPAGVGGYADDRKSLLEKTLLSRFRNPEPMFKAGGILGKFRLATALIDNSDGLMRSLEIISGASKCGIRVSLGKKAVSKELIEYAGLKKKNWRGYALSGGEDYGLIFFAKPENENRILKLIPQAVKIGAVEKGRGVFVENYGSALETFEHF